MRQHLSWPYVVVGPLYCQSSPQALRDFAQIMGNGVIDDVITDKALTMLDVDHEGLDYVDQKILRTMIEMYGGGPVGLGTLSVNIAEERERWKTCMSLT